MRSCFGNSPPIGANPDSSSSFSFALVTNTYRSIFCLCNKAEERKKSAEAVRQLAAQKEQRKKAEEERRKKAEEDRKVAEEKRARREAEEKERKRKVFSLRSIDE